MTLDLCPFDMNTTKNLIIATIFTCWIVFIATFSIQNVQLITVKFLIWESVQIPVGVFLSIVIGSGFLLGAMLPIFGGGKTPKRNKKTSRNNWRKEREQEQEEDPIFDW